MKVKSGYVVRKIEKDYVLMPVDSNLIDFSAMYSFNEAEAFLYECLQEERDIKQLIIDYFDEFYVSEADAKKDVLAFIAKLQEAELLIA